MRSLLGQIIQKRKDDEEKEEGKQKGEKKRWKKKERWNWERPSTDELRTEELKLTAEENCRKGKLRAEEIKLQIIRLETSARTSMDSKDDERNNGTKAGLKK